jgi:transcription initiation factor TFIIIB Brf1 subunit/transcription initiation factor TFIIB
MEDYDNEMNISDNIDQFDMLSDDKLWDILDNFSNDNINIKKNSLEKKYDKYHPFCNECKSINLVYTSGRGSYVCGECGTESQEIFDESPEWNNYEDGKVESGRCGAPINPFFPKSSLGTIINAPGYSKVKMLRNWGQVPYRERSLAEVLNEMDFKCKKYKITKAVIDNAKILYKNIREIKHESGANKGKNVIIRGINRKQIIAACFYFGAILQKFPRSTKEVADIFCLEIKQVTKGCRKFLEIMKDNFIIFDIKPSHGSDFIDRFGSKLKLNKETIQLSKTISENTTRLDIASDHQATSIAAASILLAINILEQNISKKNISLVFEISDVTITKTYKKIYCYQQIVISDELTSKICHKMNIKSMIDSLNEDDTISESESEKYSNTRDIQTDSETNDLINQETNNTDIIELDESDIIKKDNIQSKKNKLLFIQQEKEKRKIEKEKLKEEKKILKKIEKENKKNMAKKDSTNMKLVNSNIDDDTSDTNDLINSNTIISIESIESNSSIISIDSIKKRGRPKKNIGIIIMSV